VSQKRAVSQGSPVAPSLAAASEGAPPTFEEPPFTFAAPPPTAFPPLAPFAPPEPFMPPFAAPPFAAPSPDAPPSDAVASAPPATLPALLLMPKRPLADASRRAAPTETAAPLACAARRFRISARPAPASPVFSVDLARTRGLRAVVPKIAAVVPTRSSRGAFV